MLRDVEGNEGRQGLGWGRVQRLRQEGHEDQVVGGVEVGLRWGWLREVEGNDKADG